MTFSAIVNLFYTITDRILELLQGEPLRAIAYGSAVVIYIAARALGSIPDVSFIEAVGQATAAALVIASVVESARRFVTPA
jgi:hypothetical protein